MKDKACYIHRLFDLAGMANLRQLKIICAFADALMREQGGI